MLVGSRPTGILWLLRVRPRAVPPDRELLRLAVPLRVPAADDGDDVARRRRDGKSDPEAVGRAHDDDAPGGGGSRRLLRGGTRRCDRREGSKQFIRDDYPRSPAF